MSTVRGWCPDLFAPMRSGDGLLLRIKPTLSHLDAAAAIALSRDARRHGNGVIELTNRGNLQFRGFSERSAPLFAETALRLGLASADAALERRRNILVSPLAGDDPSCAPETREIARIIALALPADAFAALPGKFGFLVDGGGAMPLAACVADVSVRAVEGGWRVEAGGACVIANARAAAGIALQLALLVPPGERIRGDGMALFARAGHAAQPLAAAPAPSPPVPVGPIGTTSFGIGTPPGQFDAEQLRTVAELSTRMGDGVLRITPFRALLLGGLNRNGLGAVGALLREYPVVPSDPRLRVASCIGRPGCAHASMAAPADAARLAPLVPRGGLLHVSGCDKGCAHPTPAPLVLVGRDGRYNLVRDGSAGDEPVLRDLSPDRAGVVLRSLPA